MIVTHEVLDLLQEMSELSDAKLTILVNEGSADAFVELTTRYMALIRAKAAPLRSAALDADDLCQEGLLGLLRAARSYREDGKASFRTYAGVCISNQMITACRSAAGHKNPLFNHFVSLSEEEEDRSLDFPFALSQAANPETLLIDRENLEVLKNRIEKTLSKMEQRVLFLYLGGCSYSEIAAKLTISEKAVDNAIQRVRRKLKEPF